MECEDLAWYQREATVLLVRMLISLACLHFYLSGAESLSW